MVNLIKVAQEYNREFKTPPKVKSHINNFAVWLQLNGFKMIDKFIPLKYKNSPVRHIVQVDGLMYGMSGFAEALRNVAYFLDKNKINVEAIPTDSPGADNVNLSDYPIGKVLNELAINTYNKKTKPIRIAMTIPEGVRRKTKEEHLIAYIMFETQEFPKKYVEHLKKENVDEIWTPSRFNVDNIQRAGWDKPIFLMPLGVDIERFDPTTVVPFNSTESPIALFEDHYIFLSIMGWSERKGVSRLIEAYFREFKPYEEVILYIKGGWYDLERAYTEVKMVKEKLKLKDTPQIYLDFRIYNYNDLPRLYKSADAFVLASLGEGWGLNYTEAMAMGLPTIGTFGTSMMDFMNEENSFPVDVERIGREPRADWVTPDYIGADFTIPSISSLRTQMRKVYEKRFDHIPQPFRGQIDMMNNFTWEHASKRWIARLKQIK